MAKSWTVVVAFSIVVFCVLLLCFPQISATTSQPTEQPLDYYRVAVSTITGEIQKDLRTKFGKVSELDPTIRARLRNAISRFPKGFACGKTMHPTCDWIRIDIDGRAIVMMVNLDDDTRAWSQGLDTGSRSVERSKDAGLENLKREFFYALKSEILDFILQ